jgi:hypothetical protein
MRRAELTLRLEEHNEYQSHKKRRRELEKEKGEIIVEYNRLMSKRQILTLSLGMDSSFPTFSIRDEPKY